MSLASWPTYLELCWSPPNNNQRHLIALFWPASQQCRERCWFRSIWLIFATSLEQSWASEIGADRGATSRQWDWWGLRDNTTKLFRIYRGAYIYSLKAPSCKIVFQMCWYNVNAFEKWKSKTNKFNSYVWSLITIWAKWSLWRTRYKEDLWQNVVAVRVINSLNVWR